MNTVPYYIFRPNQTLTPDVKCFSSMSDRLIQAFSLIPIETVDNNYQANALVVENMFRQIIPYFAMT